MSDLNLSISQDVIKPIVEAKIKQELVKALGKSEELIEKVAEAAICSKVNWKGEVSEYSSENRYNFLDVCIKRAIEEEIRNAIKDFIQKDREKIRKVFRKILETKKGSEPLVKAFLDGFLSMSSVTITSTIPIKDKEEL